MAVTSLHAPAPDRARFLRTDALALVLILASALAFCWPLFVPGWIIPQGGGDLLSFLWPTYRYAARALGAFLAGRGPFTALLWNPTLYSGAPFAADNQTGLFYPPNLVVFLASSLFGVDLPYAALEALVALHLFIAGAGMYLFVRFEHRRLKKENWKIEHGLFPAIAFMASDVFITHLGNLNIVAASSYLPIIFLGLRQSLVVCHGEQDGYVRLRRAPSRAPRERGGGKAPMHLSVGRETLRGFAAQGDIRQNQVDRPLASDLRPLTSRAGWAILAGLAFGMAALAGHGQMTFIVAFGCGLYGLYELIRQRDTRIIVLGMLSALVAFGVAAVALLPAIELVQYTARSALEYGQASRWSLPPLGLAGMVSPLAFGRGARDFWPPWDRVEFGYMGAATLAVAVLARHKRAAFFYLLAAAAVIIAFGKYTPAHYALYRFVPGFASLRVPARFVLLTDFALAALAGFALVEGGARPLRSLTILSAASALLLLTADLNSGRQPAWLALVVALALISLTGLLFVRAPRWLPLLLFAELFAFGGFVEVDRANPNDGYKKGPAVDYLLAQPGPLRIDIATSKWQPDAPAVFGLESVAGVANPLALAAYDRYYWSVGYRGSPQYNFLNAQFVVADKDHPPADNTFVPVFNEDPDVDVYLNTNAMPRVSLIYHAVFAADSGAAFEAIHAPAFDPASQVVIESPPSAHLSEGSSLPDLPSNLYYAGYAPGQFTVVARTPTPAYLVVSEVWYPGWKAVVGDQAVVVLRANTAFMAVPIPAGESTVAFRFESPRLRLGALISLFTLLACAAVALRLRRALMVDSQ